MEDNIPYHVPTAFKLGQRVRIKRVITKAHAWYGEWSDALLPLLGTVQTIRCITKLYGFYVGPRGSGLVAWVPSPALEPVSADSFVIEVPSVDAINIMLKPRRGKP